MLQHNTRCPNQRYLRHYIEAEANATREATLNFSARQRLRFSPIVHQIVDGAIGFCQLLQPTKFNQLQTQQSHNLQGLCRLSKLV